MKISIITLFPEMFQGPFDHSIIKRAQEKNLVEIEYCNIREFGVGNHKSVDDTPYGGGVGMVMRVDVVHASINSVRCKNPQKTCNEKVVLLTARGNRFTQTIAKNYAALDHLILICGHYEGIDDRIKKYIDVELSLGDFVVTGGELPAMLVVDAVSRLLPGVITPGATDNESFSLTQEQASLLEYPHYTKPLVYDGESVPEILLSGHHKNIDAWKKEESLKKTKDVRPDLLS